LLPFTTVNRRAADVAAPVVSEYNTTMLGPSAATASNNHSRSAVARRAEYPHSARTAQRSSLTTRAASARKP
jgi:hypothetical protein